MSTNKRIPILKSTRFEVFKRDSFKCQYCGRSSPDVILECDHIIPVASGGTNELLNLITSCRDCNRGKGKKELSNLSVVSAQKELLDTLNEVREQTEMLIAWKKELMTILDIQVGAINDYLVSVSGCEANDLGNQDIKKLIKRFGFAEVYESFQIAYDSYYNGNDSSWNKAFDKVGGICYNRREQKADGGGDIAE